MRLRHCSVLRRSKIEIALQNRYARSGHVTGLKFSDQTLRVLDDDDDDQDGGW
jgi:hypothetical protein